MWEGPETGTAAQLASFPLLFKLPGPGTSTAAVTKWQFFLKKGEKKTPPVCMRLTSVLLAAAVVWVVLFKLPGSTAGERTVSNDIKKQKKMKKTHLFACGQ